MIYGLGLIAICLAWLLPGHYFPWTGFQQEFLAASGSALVALGVVMPGGPHRVRVPWIAMLGLGLAIVPMLQWATGQLPFFADAVLSSSYLLAFGLTVVAARALTELHGDRFVAALMGVVLVAGLASTGIGFAQWLPLGSVSFVELLEPRSRVFGNFTQPNHLSTLLALSVVATIWFYETRRIGGVGASVATAFLGSGMVMAQSRTGWAFVAMSMVWWLLMRRRLALRTRPVAVVIAAVLFVVATVAWPVLNAALLDQPSIAGMALGDRVQFGGRRIHWVTLWDAVWRKPWFGYGWQQVAAAQQAAALDHPASHEWITYSHNLMLDLLVWNGVPIGLMVLAAAAWWAVSRCMNCRDIDTWVMLCAGGALFMHALFEFPLAYSYFLLPFGMMIGVVEARARSDVERKPFVLRTPIFGLAIVAMIGVLGRIAVEYLQIEQTARDVSMKEAGYAPGRPPPELPKVFLLDNQREFLWFRLTEARPGMDENTLNRLRTLNQRFAPPAALLRYALAAGLNGRDADAVRNLELICNLWTVKNCHEGRDAWRQAQKQFPQLRQISFPDS